MICLPFLRFSPFLGTSPFHLFDTSLSSGFLPGVFSLHRPSSLPAHTEVSAQLNLHVSWMNFFVGSLLQVPHATAQGVFCIPPIRSVLTRTQRLLLGLYRAQPKSQSHIPSMSFFILSPPPKCGFYNSYYMPGTCKDESHIRS